MKKVLDLNALKYLFWLGPMLLIVGIVAGIVAGSWGVVPLGLIAIGVAIAIAWLFSPQGARSSFAAAFFERRSTQVGANALIALLALLVILGLVNFLAARNVARLDLTENQIFTLSPETQQLVRALPEPVKVWVFTPQPNAQDRELLEGYRRLSRNFSFEFVDPQRYPSLEKRLEMKTPGDVVVELPEKNRKQYVQTIPLADTGNPVESGLRLSELRLTNAVEQVISDRRSLAYFVEGHGERPIQAAQGAFSEAVEQLNQKAFTAESLNLVQNPEKLKTADVVVIAGPRKAFLKPEIQALKAYQDAGGSLLLMLDPDTKPELDDLLKPWGVTLDPRLVIDGSGQFAELGPAVPVVTTYGDHPITKDFGNSYSFYPLARAVDVDAKAPVKAVPLLYTNDKTWAESDLKDKTQMPQFDPTRDRPGPLVLGVALTRPVEKPATPKPSPSTSPKASVSPSPSPQASAAPSPTPSPTTSPDATKASEAPKETRMVVIGNSSFAADGLFNSNQVLNGDLFVNSMRWLSQQDRPVLSVRPKDPKNRRITLAGLQETIAVLTALVILPLVGFGLAFFLWWKRR